MISFHVSAVLLVRDGYTGQVVEGGGIACTLDGVPVRPAAKPGGYLVLVNLSEGRHELHLRAHGFQEETVELAVEREKTVSLYPVLKPGPDRFFRFPPTRMTLELGKTEGPVWLSPPGALESKLTQAKAEPGDTGLRLFCKGGADRLPVPGPFLLEDGKKSEICVLDSFRGETALLAAPLANGHSRGRRLLPAGQYQCADGLVTAVFPQPGTVLILGPGKEGVQSVELAQGNNQVSLLRK